MQKVYEVRLIILSKKDKYKAIINKNGSFCIALCAKSDKEAYELLQDVVCGDDSRPIKHKKKIGEFIVDSNCSKYLFLLRKECVDSYIKSV